MVGTTLPTPMYALYGQQMHFAVLTTTVIYATYAAGVGKLLEDVIAWDGKSWEMP